MKLQETFPEIFTSIGLPTILGYIIYWIINRRKVKSEGDLKAADYVDKILEIGRKQLEDISKEFDQVRLMNIELMKQNTFIIEKNKILLEENLELRKSISDVKNRVNDLEKREQKLISENKILTKQVSDLSTKLKEHENRTK